MAYRGSPQDLFASEDSDSDATVDLSVPPGTGARADNDLVIILSDSDSMPYSAQQNQKHRSRLQRSQHTVSSSDFDSDSHEASEDNKCLLGPGSEDKVRANRVAETLSSGHNTAASANKRVVRSEQSVMDQLHDRPLCKYGVNCYRRNPSHFQEFRHPGNV